MGLLQRVQGWQGWCSSTSSATNQASHPPPHAPHPIPPAAGGLCLLDVVGAELGCHGAHWWVQL